MFSKTSSLIAFILVVGRAHAQCSNGGIGVGLEQLCNIGNPISGGNCDDLEGFITAPGSFNTISSKDNIGDYSDLCGLGWTGEAYTVCDSNNNIISVNPPNEGTLDCSPADITVPGSSNLGVASIGYCCY
ncbi:hypothetical protein B0H11DRAFT_2138020 [Mycena galericulata]|nr:hypothetical protein B0H11DRAFT_2138020 [Mycena galericulata]